MATTPTPAPTQEQPLSPELQKIQAEIAAANAAPPAAPPAEVVVEIKGQVFKGKDHVEVAEKLTKAQEFATDEIKRLRDELKARETPPPATTDQFEKQKYFDLLEQDPRAATRYAMGFDPEIQKVLGTVGEVEQRMVASQFTARHPDFPAGDPVAAQALIDYMDKAGRPATPEMLSLSWYEMRDSGQLRPVETKPAESFTRPTPPPASPQGSTSPAATETDVIRDFSRLTTAQMEEQLRKIGMKRY